MKIQRIGLVLLLAMSACKDGVSEQDASPSDGATVDGGNPGDGGDAMPLASFHSTFDMTGDSKFQDVVELAGGDMIAVGAVSSFGAGMADGFVARIAANGSYVWSRSLGTTNPDGLVAVTADGAGGVVVVGQSRYPQVVSFVARFDGNGTLIFSENLNAPKAGLFIDSNLVVTDVVRMADGNFALVAHHEDDDTTQAGTGVFRGWIGVISPQGALLRQRRYGSMDAYLGFYQGALLANGDLAVAGWWNLSTLVMRVDPNLTVKWRSTQASLSNDRGIALVSILPLASGDLILGGQYFEANFASTVTHYFLQRLTGTGTGVWSRRLNQANSGAYSLIPHGGNEFVALGYAPNTKDQDAYAAVLDNDGFLMSQTSLGLAGADALTAGVVSSGGSLVVAGSKAGTPYGSARIARIPSTLPTCDSAASPRLASVTYATAPAPDTTDFGAAYTVTVSTTNAPVVANGPSTRTATAVCPP